MGSQIAKEMEHLLADIFTEPRHTVVPSYKRDYRKIHAVYRCSCPDDQLEMCTRFTPDSQFSCQFRRDDDGFKSCINTGIA